MPGRRPDTTYNSMKAVNLSQNHCRCRCCCHRVTPSGPLSTLARVPDDNPCALSHHMAWTRSSCIAKQDLPTLDSQFTNFTFLSINLHDPTHDTTKFTVADRSSPTPAHRLDRSPRLRQPPLHNQQHQNGLSQKDLVEGSQPKAQEQDSKC